MKAVSLQANTTADVVKKRKQYVGYNTTLLYSEPLHIVAGKGCKLYSAEGREYLDGANNVAHVGHSHPKVEYFLFPCTNTHCPCTILSCSLYVRNQKACMSANQKNLSTGTASDYHTFYTVIEFRRKENVAP